MNRNSLTFRVSRCYLCSVQEARAAAPNNKHTRARLKQFPETAIRYGVLTLSALPKRVYKSRPASPGLA